MRSRTVARATIVGVVVLIALTFTLKRAWGTEAPGCGDQHYRPRLAQCCPKYLAGETLPPKCTHALADGFLDQCCGAEPTPQVSATPVQTCPGPEWDKCWPGPQATYTPGFDSKNSCCIYVRRKYKAERTTINEKRRVALFELIMWKRQAMVECRIQYDR